mgnify:CR=1 FL=1
MVYFNHRSYNDILYLKRYAPGLFYYYHGNYYRPFVAISATQVIMK